MSDKTIDIVQRFINDNYDVECNNEDHNYKFFKKTEEQDDVVIENPYQAFLESEKWKKYCHKNKNE